MALAVSLLFDDASTRAVEGLWQALAVAGISRDMLDLGYPPHVTLVVVDDETLEAPLRRALTLADGQRVMQMRLGPVRRFEGTDIVWLAADGGVDLVALQRQVAATVPLETIRPHYRSGQWTPHMTLQTLGDAEAALRLVNPLWPRPGDALATRLELARFLPVEVVAGASLAA